MFAGYGIYTCNGVDCSLENTSLRVLKSRARFKNYTFLTQSSRVAESLKPLVAPYNVSGNIKVISGNPNQERTLCHLLDNVPRSASSFVLIDPGGYRRLNWSTLEKLTAQSKNWQGKKAELLIIFPLEMALLRNLMRPECEDSITSFYGNRQWQDIRRRKQIKKMEPADIKNSLVELFKNGLHNLGYRHVEDFKPAAPTHDPYYHLIYASDSVSRLNSIKEAWGKPRFLRCELLYHIDKTRRNRNNDNQSRH